ncbi:MAG: IS1595 family transposase, partial [Pseudomonadota bacterium]|nr:IS1595 family transposase [Pseudomonadota bacterium]MDQ3269645.1 IS1595 family transposase [Pseudomonadota bacterium]
RRFHLPELVPRLLRAMVLCSPCAEPALRQATNFRS